MCGMNLHFVRSGINGSFGGMNVILNALLNFIPTLAPLSIGALRSKASGGLVAHEGRSYVGPSEGAEERGRDGRDLGWFVRYLLRETPREQSSYQGVSVLLPRANFFPPSEKTSRTQLAVAVRKKTPSSSITARSRSTSSGMTTPICSTSTSR
jgi:hypothetical protein